MDGGYGYGYDVDWASVLNAMNTNNDLAMYAAPGAWNDPDMYALSLFLSSLFSL